jgi:hypothetical protein
MVFIEVELWAFRDAGKIRKVWIPNDQKLSLANAYHFGQNDFQPQAMRSVSCGDIIRFNGKRYMVWSIGFRRVPLDFTPDTNDPMLGYHSFGGKFTHATKNTTDNSLSNV